MGDSLHSLLAVWQDVLLDDPGRALLRVTRTTEGKLVNYRARNLFSRAHRFASGFAEATQLSPGSRVAVLAQPNDDVAIVLHGLWLLRMTAVVIDWKSYSSRLIREFDELGVSAVIVDVESRPKVAGLLASVESLTHWFVIGTSPQEEPSHRYEALLAGRLDQTLLAESNQIDAEALIVYTEDGEKRFCRSIFSQSSLCLQALIWKQHLPDNSADDKLAYVSAETSSFEFIFFNFVAPLFSGVPCLLDADIEVKRFWEHVKSDGFDWVYLSQADLLAVLKRGRPSFWKTFEDLIIYVGTEKPLSAALLKDFEDTFSILVHTTFARADLGGFISIFPQNLGTEAHRAWLLDQPIPSSGMLLDHVSIKFIDEFGYEVMQALRGQLHVTMTGMEEWLETGLDGFYAEDNKDRAHVFVYGHHSDGILRFGQYVNLAPIDIAIQNLRGIAFGMAVGFSNIHAGLEVGAYIVPVKAIAHEVDDHEILAQLRLMLPEHECPKVIVRGKYPRVYGEWPKREDVLERFRKFRKINYAVNGA